MDDETTEALGKLRKALETTERARGHLYSFHQLTGTADFELDDAIAALRGAGHGEHAKRVQVFRDVERAARDDLAGGQRHGLEKQRDRQRPNNSAYAERD